MSQFNYMNEINSLLTMDGDIGKGPAPRWQKKMNASSTTLNGSINTSKISMSFNSAMSSSALNVTNKTPQKVPSVNFKGKKTPGKSPGRKTPTPNKAVAAAKTPCGGGDRFIPNRVTSNFELGHYKMKLQQCVDENADNVNTEKKPDERQKLISEAMQIGDVNQRRIFSFQEKAPAAPESHQNPLRVVYSIKTPMSTKSGTRYIPTSPERILDAPDIINDYCA